MESPITRLAVLGAGDAGCALAGLAAAAGIDVALWNRSPRRLEAITDGVLTVIDAGGATRSTVRVERCDDLAAACAGADVVLLAVSSSEQPALVAGAWPHMRDARAVVLVPGHTGGALAARHAVADRGGSAVLAEMPLPFVCRAAGPGEIHLRQHKRDVPVAALPASAAARLADALAGVYRGVRAAGSVWETGLGNVTAVLQPVLALTNLARIDRAEPFGIYSEGMSPAVGRIVDALDRERIELAAALGLDLPSAADWFDRVYGAAGTGIAERVAGTPGYAGIAAPTSVRHRFLNEHVSTGAVPMASLAAVAGTPRAALDSLIGLSSAAVGVDLRATGCDLARMGLAGYHDIHEIARAVRLIGPPAWEGAEWPSPR